MLRGARRFRRYLIIHQLIWRELSWIAEEQFAFGSSRERKANRLFLIARWARCDARRLGSRLFISSHDGYYIDSWKLAAINWLYDGFCPRLLERTYHFCCKRIWPHVNDPLVLRRSSRSLSKIDRGNVCCWNSESAILPQCSVREALWWDHHFLHIGCASFQQAYSWWKARTGYCPAEWPLLFGHLKSELRLWFWAGFVSVIMSRSLLVKLWAVDKAAWVWRMIQFIAIIYFFGRYEISSIAKVDSWPGTKPWKGSLALCALSRFSKTFPAHRRVEDINMSKILFTFHENTYIVGTHDRASISVQDLLKYTAVEPDLSLDTMRHSPNSKRYSLFKMRSDKSSPGNRTELVSWYRCLVGISFNFRLVWNAWKSKFSSWGHDSQSVQEICPWFHGWRDQL